MFKGICGMESIRKGRFGDRGYRIRGRFIVTAAEWNIPDDAYRWNAILMIKAIHLSLIHI